MESPRKLDKLLSDLIHEGKSKKAKEIDASLINYIQYLNEDKKDQYTQKKYKRGQILFVDFGYNVGRELQRSHFAIVLNNSDSINAYTINVIPLSSIKENRDVHPFEVDIGTEIIDSILKQLEASIDSVSKQYTDLNKMTKWIENNRAGKANNNATDKESLVDLENKFKNIVYDLASLKKIKLFNVGKDMINTKEFRLIYRGVCLHKLFRRISIFKFVEINDVEKFMSTFEYYSGQVEEDHIGSKIKLKSTSEEIISLKAYSRVLITQITTVSKQRIIFPLYENDYLDSVCIGANTMKKIDSKIKQILL